MSLNPLPFDLKKQDFDKFTEFFQKKQENNSLKETLTQNKNKLRAGRPKNNIPQKQFIDIPIISHDSQKPTIVYEEINSGKKNSCKKEKGLICKNHKNISSKKYDIIPIITHDSQKPNIVYEEVNNGKNKSNIKGHYIEKKNSVCKNNNKNKNLTGTKNYEIIPVVIHESEKPSCIYEEVSSGKLYSNKIFSNPDHKKAQKLKCINKNFKNSDSNKKYEEVLITEHESFLPSIVYEEINNGKKSPFCESKSIISKPNSNKQLLKCAKKNMNNKKYEEIPIIEHESLKPAMIYEETYGGKISTPLHKFFGKEFCNNNTCESKNENKEKSSILIHESMVPSLVYEEVNNGKKSPFCLITGNNTKNVSLKNKKCNSNKKFEEIPVIEHNSQKPTKVYEEVNNGKF